MADTSGQALLRGINIDKVSKDYEEEALIFKNDVNVTTTSARECRWYQKTSGYLTSTYPAKIASIAEGARPFVLEQSWTRNTSYVKKYMLESPMINMEDESDSEVKVFLQNLKDIVQAIAYDEDGDIWDIATEDQTPVNINSVTTVAAWDAASGQDPMRDVSEALRKIRQQTKRKIKNPKLYVSAKGEEDLKVWLTTSKGTYFTELASKLMSDGVLSRFSSCEVVVSENVTADYALVGVLKESVGFKQFKPMTTAIIVEELIGRKIRASTHGVAILEKPKYNALISNTEA